MAEKNSSERRRSIGWMGINRGHHARPIEWILEKGIFLISFSAILMIFLIFLFIGKEAVPILFERVNSAAAQKVLSSEEVEKLSKAELAEYLGVSPTELKKMDDETVKLLLEVKAESAKEAPTDKDAAINTASWRYMLKPYQWTGYEKPEYIWQPVSAIHKYNIIPLLIGSLKTSLVALAFSVPLSLAAAIYVSQLAPPVVKEIVKPCIELLAGIPSVVLGFFALLVMATVFQNVFGYESRLNAFVAGIALGLAVIPVTFSISEDALTSVPSSYTQAALGLGSSKWQAAWKIVLPAAIPGVFAAVILGFGRAIGETMIVLMASGNASIMSLSIFDSTRTITATIAAELAETVFGGHHYRILFTLGLMLFTVTFLANLAGEMTIQRLKRHLEGKA
ncbi:MAG: phosphate ABC transporter permease subunit PstC [Verrucomicrobiota bacterium]|nr:phosphate ABC transporter permease subunit PstC [Verrucomicrobiota bacterium]